MRCHSGRAKRDERNIVVIALMRDRAVGTFGSSDREARRFSRPSMGVFSRAKAATSTTSTTEESAPPSSSPPVLPPGSLFGRPPPRPPLRNPGWRERVAEHTGMSFAAGLASGAGYALYTERLDFAPAIAAVAGNVTLVGCSFACAKEATRLVRQKDDWVNSFTGGGIVGSACATAWRGRPYSPAGALAFGAVAGGTHFLFDPSNTEWLCKVAGFRSITKPDGEVDWVTPQWFPIRRVSDDELEVNEIEFQMRVAAVLDGRVDAKEAERVRLEYRSRRAREKARRAGKARGEEK